MDIKDIQTFLNNAGDELAYGIPGSIIKAADATKYDKVLDLPGHQAARDLGRGTGLALGILTGSTETKLAKWLAEKAANKAPEVAKVLKEGANWVGNVVSGGVRGGTEAYQRDNEDVLGSIAVGTAMGGVGKALQSAKEAVKPVSSATAAFLKAKMDPAFVRERALKLAEKRLAKLQPDLQNKYLDPLTRENFKHAEDLILSNRKIQSVPQGTGVSSTSSVYDKYFREGNRSSDSLAYLFKEVKDSPEALRKFQIVAKQLYDMEPDKAATIFGDMIRQNPKILSGTFRSGVYGDISRGITKGDVYKVKEGVDKASSMKAVDPRKWYGDTLKITKDIADATRPPSSARDAMDTLRALGYRDNVVANKFDSIVNPKEINPLIKPTALISTPINELFVAKIQKLVMEEDKEALKSLLSRLNKEDIMNMLADVAKNSKKIHINPQEFFLNEIQPYLTPVLNRSVAMIKSGYGDQ